MRRWILALALILGLLVPAALADPAGAAGVLRRVKDIVPGSGSGAPAELTVIGSTIYFTAATGVGRELWKSDGTDAGTVLVKDINPGPSSSGITYLTRVGQSLYFTALDAADGYELWKSDGTAVGTVVVKDIYPGTTSSYPGCFLAVGRTMYFTATEASTGTELWRTDGTASGTVLVKDIWPGTSSGMPSAPSGCAVGDHPWFTRMGGAVYFRGNDGVNGAELWRTNGSASGTYMVKDIWPGGDSAPWQLTAVGSQLFFAAADRYLNEELWKSDGTAQGTVMVKDINPGPVGSSNPYWLTALGDRLVFSAIDPDGNYYSDVWASDGTEAGTVSITPGVPPDTGSFDPTLLTALGREVLFQAWGDPETQELWKTDGTEAGTILLKDLAVTGTQGATFVRVGGLAYFAGDDGVTGNKLWSTDLTPGGTVLAADILNPFFMVRLGSTLYFAGTDGNGGELWAYG
jgi:ELWxxDGT repeat protein